MNEKEEKIYNFLKEHVGRKFNLSEINEELKNISYPIILKWVEVLSAKGKIKLERDGIKKIVWVEK